MAGTKRSERGGVNSSVGSRAHAPLRGRQSQSHRSRSPKQSSKQSETHKFVTLEDVKSAARAKLLDMELKLPAGFDGMYSTNEFDEFLVQVLNYFDCFFSKNAQELKPNPMNIEPSLREIQMYKNLCLRLEDAQKQLGQTYCVLLLGAGMQEHHHMSCGMSRVSNTYKDRDMYEALYSFCAYLVWINFRRTAKEGKEDYKVVKQELGRMLRSNTFNPAIRIKNAPETGVSEEDVQEVTEEEEKKLTPAEYRRLQGKRPAIKSVINQRSPALISVMPSPKDAALWLFERGGTLKSLSNDTAGSNNDDLNQPLMSVKLDLQDLKVGIIGEPMSQFNPQTLMPLGTDTEDDIQDDGSSQSHTHIEQI